jgi:hypothetical protein
MKDELSLKTLGKGFAKKVRGLHDFEIYRFLDFNSFTIIIQFLLLPNYPILKL